MIIFTLGFIAGLIAIAAVVAVIQVLIVKGTKWNGSHYNLDESDFKEMEKRHEWLKDNAHD